MAADVQISMADQTEKIRDIQSYINSMSRTMGDKCWWADRIAPEIDTVIDFGCANGDLAVYLNRLCPGRFRYIGIDNSPEMLAMAKHNHFLHFGLYDSRFCRELSELKDLSFGGRRLEPGRTVLVLNSVMHEILSYLPDTVSDELFREMAEELGPAAIAVRDMYLYDIAGKIDCGFFNRTVGRTPYAGSWVEFSRDHRELVEEERILEFLLKYRYTNNWEREKREKYLWDWMPRFGEERRGYAVSYDSAFYIPYIRQRIREDIGLDLTVNTHRKVLFTKSA